MLFLQDFSRQIQARRWLPLVCKGLWLIGIYVVSVFARVLVALAIRAAMG